MVCCRVDVGIDAQSDGSLQLLPACDPVDVIELGFAFDVKAEDARSERILNFLA